MGQDKAFLDVEGAPLISRVAEAVVKAAGSVTLIGDPGKYANLGYPIEEDEYKSCGPLAGIHKALSVTPADWNLIVACDMPELEPQFLGDLMAKAERSNPDCLLPEGKRGLEPLCAVYHRRAEAQIRKALESGVKKVLEGLSALRVEVIQVPIRNQFRNVNTPEDWQRYRNSQTNKTRPDRD